MTISLLWLKDYLQLTLTPEQISEALTSLGLEVEKMEIWESVQGGLKGIVAGKVLTCSKHPDADRLSLTTVDIGNEKPSSIVCGGPNIATGQTVWVAVPGTMIFDKDGKARQINTSKIRGALSEGMICAEDEMGLGESHEGVLVLPDDVPVGTKASDYYKVYTDVLFEIGLTPNRSDATSILGVAADLAAFLNVQHDVYHPVTWPSLPEISKASAPKPFKVSVRNNIACPRYSGVIVSGLTIKPSPDWMQQRLKAIGIKTINNVVDITNFVLHEMGQPLHAFDAEKINGQEIIVQTLDTGTPFLALDGITYKLHNEDLMICDGNGHPMCIGGVYGGLNSGVTDKTTSIFLEAAHFNAGFVRRTSMRHNLRTEAARRFEKGSDPNITLKALSRAVDLLSSMAGGKVVSQVFDIYPVPVEPVKVKLSLKNLVQKTGIAFTADRVEKVLDALSMDFEKHGVPVDHWTVSVPTNKSDVLREIDVIEEVLRVYGFVNVPMPGRMQSSVAIEPRHSPHHMRRLIGHFLASNGFLEAMNMSLTQPAYYNGLDWVDPKKWITIHNTSNESLNLLRPEMIIPMLETIKRNINRKQEHIRMYEFGKAYLQEKEQPVENEYLVLTLTGNKNLPNWQKGDTGPVDFFSLKSSVHALLIRLGIKNWDMVSVTGKNGFDYGLEYSLGSGLLVEYGKVSKFLCDRFDIRQEVFMAIFGVEALQSSSSRATTIVKELNRFPPVVRDLAIVIDEQTAFDEVRRVVLEAGAQWLTAFEVFDIYRNEDQLGSGKKSMALRFTIENRDATLSDKDIDQWFLRVQKALQVGVKAEIRR